MQLKMIKHVFHSSQRQFLYRGEDRKIEHLFSLPGFSDFKLPKLGFPFDLRNSQHTLLRLK